MCRSVKSSTGLRILAAAWASPEPPVVFLNATLWRHLLQKTAAARSPPPVTVCERSPQPLAMAQQQERTSTKQLPRAKLRYRGNQPLTAHELALYALLHVSFGGKSEAYKSHGTENQSHHRVSSTMNHLFPAEGVVTPCAINSYFMHSRSKSRGNQLGKILNNYRWNYSRTCPCDHLPKSDHLKIADTQFQSLEFADSNVRSAFLKMATTWEMRIADTKGRPKASIQPAKSDHIRKIERKTLFFDCLTFPSQALRTSDHRVCKLRLARSLPVTPPLTRANPTDR